MAWCHLGDVASICKDTSYIYMHVGSEIKFFSILWCWFRILKLNVIEILFSMPLLMVCLQELLGTLEFVYITRNISLYGDFMKFQWIDGYQLSYLDFNREPYLADKEEAEKFQPDLVRPVSGGVAAE